ncbi:hypothetical protein CHH83_06320 [Bacillus sp. 7586-K]|nr:hypothetical protein CHH83_06320 [Bacillus sp. 7586-K]
MTKIEKQLEIEKKRLDSLKVPEELEDRLRNALHSAAPKNTNRRLTNWMIAVVCLFTILTIGYHFDALAYYSKKILGFDAVMSGTLQRLNEDGMGQIIEKKLVLEDGTELLINGIMTDANQLVMYYTLSNPNGLDQSEELFSPKSITGFLTNSEIESGTSIINEEKTEIKGTMSFEPVNPFAKKLTLHISQRLKHNQVKEDSVTFPFHPNKAIQTEIKQPIKKTVKVDKGTITFNKITASPTITVIEGRLNVENFDRVDLSLNGVELFANGKPIELLSSGSHSSLNGQKFELQYDALPDQVESLILNVQQFAGYERLDKEFSLNNMKEAPYLLNKKKLWMKKLSMTSEGVQITIVTEQDVMLDGVSVKTKNEMIPLNTTVNEVNKTLPDGTEGKERTLLFNTDSRPEALFIEGIHYMKSYGYEIDIPVDK